MNILVTGCAGFVGFSLIKKLARTGDKIYGIDNFTKNYNKKLKVVRLKILKNYFKNKKSKFNFKKLDLKNSKELEKLTFLKKIDVVFNFAAIPGVRYSIKYPKKVFINNTKIFNNILSLIPQAKLVIYASSSNVYSGLNKSIPFKESLKLGKQKNSYGRSKRNNEIIAQRSKNKTQKLIGLRFFSVYGPWGRPDMAYFKFTKNIYLDKQIILYGDNYRDMTYIDDVVEIIIKILKDYRVNKIYKYFKNSKNNSVIYNIGAGSKVRTSKLIKIIEKLSKKSAIILSKPYNKFEMKSTLSNSSKIISLTKYKNFKKVNIGMKKFNAWFKKHYINY